MKTAYRVLAYIIAIEVAIQAAAIAFGLFGLTKWISDGGTLDKASMESESTTFPGLIGFIVHGINGQMVIPAIALVLLIVSFFAKVAGGAKWAGTILVLVVIQVLLGFYAHEAPLLGPLHGINALLIFSLAVMTGRRAASVAETRSVRTTDQQQEAA
jgi:hypothetical protein